WRMPTLAQIQELLRKTTSGWTTQNGVKGRLFTGSNGGTIFLPAAGDRWGAGLHDEGSRGYFWSSSLYESRPSHAYVYFDTGYEDWDVSYRRYGFPVRPVRKN
ncbi:MAG: hypothetical protein IKQ62_05620, partial [Bacteroidaceae bacterium]|nr:hypothetical protein [Bacteroidaceae bacterium]